MYSYSPNNFDLGNSTGWVSKWEKIEEILKLEKKNPFKPASWSPQSFYQSRHMEKETPETKHPSTLQHSSQHWLHPRESWSIKCVKLEQYSCMGTASLFVTGKEEEADRERWSPEGPWRLTILLTFNGTHNLTSFVNV